MHKQYSTEGIIHSRSDTELIVTKASNWWSLHCSILTAPVQYTAPATLTRTHVSYDLHLRTTVTVDPACHEGWVSLQWTEPTYRSVPHIRPPLAYKPPLCFQPKFLHRYFYLAYRPPNHGHSTKMIFVETPTLSSSRSPWQRKNGASVHRTAKEFAVDR